MMNYIISIIFVAYLTTMSTAQNLLYQMMQHIVNDETERPWKEAVMAQFKALFQHLLKATEQEHEKPQSK
jgi:hypothetical protein